MNPCTHYFCKIYGKQYDIRRAGKKRPGSLVEKIVTELLSKDAVDVHFEDEDDEQWAVIKVHIYEEDKEMALRLLSDNSWILQFGY
jgi:hypothetical protein